MAEALIDLLSGAKPESGSFFAPASQYATQDVYDGEVLVVPDGGADVEVYPAPVSVPGGITLTTVELVLVVASQATANDWIIDFDYRAVGGSETLDPSSWQESVTTGAQTIPGTAFDRQRVTVALTAGNFAALDTVLSRLLVNAGDAGYDLADELLVYEAYIRIASS